MEMTTTKNPKIGHAETLKHTRKHVKEKIKLNFQSASSRYGE